jgi:3-methyladenine DNA glycosylase/8-oxoguanine DNA glycosylase
MPEASFKITPPYNFALSLTFARCTRFEIEDDNGADILQKILQINGKPVFVKIICDGDIYNPRAAVSWSALNGGLPSRKDIIYTVKRIISADLDLTSFYRLCRKSKHFSKIIGQFCGLKPILTPTVFESAAWAIMGQQVNLNFASILKNRLVEKYGQELNIDGRSFSLFPLPEKISRAQISELRSFQFSKRSIRGIGVWSANYILMRGAGHLNCLPLGDSGLHRAVKNLYRLKTIPDNEKVEKLAQKFIPYRSLYTLYLWCSLLKGEK